MMTPKPPQMPAASRMCAVICEGKREANDWRNQTSTHLYHLQEMLLIGPTTKEVEQHENQRYENHDEGEREEQLREYHEDCNEIKRLIDLIRGELRIRNLRGIKKPRISS